jgi:hypothetical protein
VDCKRVNEELIAFHLSALDGATRAAVEAHLCGCARCVGAYLMLKRAVDAGEDAPAPSELTRRRVREAACVELARRADEPKRVAPARMARPRMALWAAAAALLVAAPLLYRPWRTAPSTSPAKSAPAGAAATVPQSAGAVDTARATPESLTFL